MATGTIEIDNSAVERALRGIALVRKNYLFAAAINSVVETAKLRGLDPEAYLREVLACVADHPIYRIDEPVEHDPTNQAAGGSLIWRHGKELGAPCSS